MPILTRNEPVRSILWLVAAILAVGVVLPLVYHFVWQRGRSPLIVYCTHDAVFSEPVLRDFEKRTGIPVAIRFDSEATKSLGLIEQIIAEKDHPRCDVFWNNELLGMMDLQKRGVLMAYKSPNAARIPAGFKDAEGYWTGFAGRLRVVMFGRPAGLRVTSGFGGSTQSGNVRFGYVPEVAASTGDTIAMAKPLYGTTFTHYCVLWNLWGAEKLKAWHKDRERIGVREVMGNAQVQQAVATGACSFGFTDTDDFYAAKDDGATVDMVVARVGNNQTICIPNTVAIIKGTAHEAEAKELVDYLLSEESELALANSKSRQIPLGPVDESKLPAEVKELKKYVADAYPLAGLGTAREECLAWLKTEYIK